MRQIITINLLVKYLLLKFSFSIYSKLIFWENKGICVIGNFENKVPNPLALDAVKSLIKCGVESGYINQDYILKGHRQVRATACPGND